MKVLLDTDVLLDVALDREAFVDESSAVVQWCQQTPGGALVAWHTISNVYYILRVARNDAKAREFVADLLAFAGVASGTTENVRQALTMRMSEFEDAMQVAAAMSGHADLIVTRNVPDYRHSVIPAITPRQFRTRVARIS
ncbi:MAG TPA: PIN domain-containing protein [Candidatus Udaeobacter sp.]|nr:PIN domain-containing protein [Candidatus Udaeobacter sp.]